MMDISTFGRLKRTLRGSIARSPYQQTSRALVKTLLYRTVMVITTVTVAFFVTGNTGEALSIGLVANVIKTGTYYGYERLWDRISWGISNTAESTRQ